MDEVVYIIKKNLYINLTNRCTCNCIFCDKNMLQDWAGADLRLTTEPEPETIIKEIKKKLQNRSFEEIVFCGIGEPLLRLDTVIKIIKQLKDITTIKIRVNTNGHAKLIYKDRDIAKELKDAGLDKINISLNALDQKEYEKICRPENEIKIEKIIDFIENCKKNNIHTTISFVQKYINEEKAGSLAKRLDVHLKIRKKI